MLSSFVQKPGTIARVAVIPFVTALLPVGSSSSAWLARLPATFFMAWLVREIREAGPALAEAA